MDMLSYILAKNRIKDHNESVDSHDDIRQSINDLEAERKKYARFTISANQSIPNNTNTEIVWGTKTKYNGEDFCEIDIATNRVKILKTGMYQVNLNVAFAGNATGSRILWGNALMSYYPNDSNPCYTSMSYSIYVNAGSLLNIRVNQASGGALDVIISGTYCEIRKVA